ncbi:DUF1656 domain-containing protein [Celerinatantimonas yamalensis]|uniref:DUF1656 domain-containing protein n=1 Tax=Celerinatantimonas yamalensis TaxID=559956 RepID=A0ABW9G345_9GAMM
MFQNITLGGLLFSPLVIFIPIAFVLSAITRLILHKLHIHQYIWKVAWFEVASFVCYLAITVYLLGGVTYS